jgi:hypothetical protein
MCTMTNECMYYLLIRNNKNAYLIGWRNLYGHRGVNIHNIKFIRKEQEEKQNIVR